jgi:hypothetical protein
LQLQASAFLRVCHDRFEQICWADENWSSAWLVLNSLSLCDDDIVE